MIRKTALKFEHDDDSLSSWLMCGDDTNGCFTFDAYLKPSFGKPGHYVEFTKRFLN
jgi:hypothetical protein